MIWDIRMVDSFMQMNASPHTDKTFSATSCCFDKSAEVVAVSCEDANIRIFNVADGEMVICLNDHKEIVHDVKFDFNSNTLVSCGADNTVRIFGS